MNDRQPDGCTGFAFGVVVIMVLIGFLSLVGGAPSGGGSTSGSNNTEVHIASDNDIRLFSPETNVYVNSGNTAVTGDRNQVDMNPPCFAWNGTGEPGNPRICVSWRNMANGSPQPTSGGGQ